MNAITRFEISKPAEFFEANLENPLEILSHETEMVSEGLNRFAHSVRRNQHSDALAAVVNNLEHWLINKSTVSSLLEHHIQQVKDTIAQPRSAFEFAVQSRVLTQACDRLVEQLFFLAEVFGLETSLIDQLYRTPACATVFD